VRNFWFLIFFCRFFEKCINFFLRRLSHIL
jgi:hypothetical protein